MRLALITPSRNRRELLVSTVMSVLAQRMGTDDKVEIDYLVVDGASTDGSQEALERCSESDRAHGIRFRWISEPDRGLGDALTKGFERVSGDLYGYLGAGDLLWATATAALSGIRPADDDWICGLHATFDESGTLRRVRHPWRYRNDYLRRGLYGRTILPYVQQESTFWSEGLMTQVDLRRLAGMRAATDGLLWKTFADGGHAPRIVPQLLGGWREHADHLGMSNIFRSEVSDLYPELKPIDSAAATVEYLRWRAVRFSPSSWFELHRAYEQ